MLHTDQVAQLPDCHGAAPEVPEFPGAVKTGGVPVNMVMNMLLVRVSADDEGVVAF